MINEGQIGEHWLVLFCLIWVGLAARVHGLSCMQRSWLRLRRCRFVVHGRNATYGAETKKQCAKENQRWQQEKVETDTREQKMQARLRACMNKWWSIGGSNP